MNKTDELDASAQAPTALSAPSPDGLTAPIAGASRAAATSHTPGPWGAHTCGKCADLLAACKAVRAALEKVQRYDPYVMEDEAALMDAAISKAEGS